jgi:hypothetical protein
MKSIFHIADDVGRTIAPSKQEIDLQYFSEHQERKPCDEARANEKEGSVLMDCSTTQPHTSHHSHVHETLASTDLWHI